MNLDLDDLARLAWDQLWQVTVVAIVIGAAVKASCRDRPRLAYSLWMLVIVKSIVPPIWSSPTGLFSWALVARESPGPDGRPWAGEPPGGRRVPILSGGDPALVESPSNGHTGPETRSDWPHAGRIAFLAWAAGLGLGTAYVLGKQVACSGLIRRSTLPAEERYDSALADLAARLGLRRKVRLVVTTRPIGPAAYGLLRPKILLPGPLLRGQPMDRVELILAHELVHVRRGDVLAGKLQLAAQLIWWFHPLVWWANGEAVRERERCCDEEVVSGLGCKPSHYARALLGVLEQKVRLRSLVALPGVRALEVTKLRLESIMKHAVADRRRAARTSRLAFAAGAILLIPGTGLVLQADPPSHADIDSTPRPSVTAEVSAGSADGRPGDAPGLQRAEERVRWAEAMYRKGYVSLAQLEADRAKAQRLRNPGPADAARAKADPPATVAELEHATERIRWAEAMQERGYVSKTQLEKGREDLRRVRAQLAMAATPRAAAPAAILKGVVREKGTGRPVAGARISVTAAAGEPGRDPATGVTDEAGRYTVAELPRSREYVLIASPGAGGPHLITSRRVEAADGDGPVTADVEFVRGIPFRVRVLDQGTGKALKGRLSYFPISPNNPFERGAMGYVATASKDGSACGAFCESDPDEEGQFLGGVLPGPGILGFSHPYKPGEESRADRKPVVSFPDGRAGVRLTPNERGGPLGFVPISSDPLKWTGLPLGQFDAVIAIDPREGAEVATYEIRIPADDRR